MAYKIVIDPEVREEIEVLPRTALSVFAEAMTVLELTPWSGEPQHRDNPDGAVRRMVFGPAGAGIVVYLVLEDQRRVDVLRVVWLSGPRHDPYSLWLSERPQ